MSATESFRRAVVDAITVGSTFDDLVAIAREHRDRGLSRADAMSALESVRGTLAEDAADRILELMDIVVGFCAPRHRVWGALCPVCGYDDLDEAPRDELDCASFEICPCCGTQFGYDDAARDHASLRDEWVGTGMAWWSRSHKPPIGWDPAEQLGRLSRR